MTKKIRKIVLFTIVTTLLTVTGCGDKKNTDTATSNKPAIAYIVANTANSKPVDSSAPIIQDTMIDCAENYGYSFIVRVDGEPELVSIENLDIDPQYKNAAKERLKRDATNKATNLLQVLEGVHAVIQNLIIWKPFASRQPLSEALTIAIPPEILSVVEVDSELRDISIFKTTC